MSRNLPRFWMDEVALTFLREVLEKHRTPDHVNID
jgi:hypothetical protein